ncbi:amidohydrolase family protein [Scandinavium sp. H11S7]|uniref:Amidohydrolase family protein n=1 Tax=Scandinavium hiltneri TaxID=2926519 RepID=A0ABT2E150_9ENTR|nr:amidohydrolase family protein [Scandinavium hiltneri]MCS2159048.1 amidohydrolase family protein [Scandinavium hiltneri]MCS2161581.1 amidohydrolase family protein [Scandinavium hiltneri]
MKIISIEEHVSDPALSQACHKAQSIEAPYFGDWARQSKDAPDTRLAGAATAMRLAQECGEDRIADMDANGIDMQILSYSNSPQLLAPAEAIPLTRDANDKLAVMVNAHPTRFGAFATLPWSDPQAAADELKRCVETLGFKGALLTGRPGDTFLDDPRYAPVLAAAADLNVPLYLHPGVPLPVVQQAYYSGFDPDVSARFSLFGWGWHCEPGVQLVRMMLAGVFERYPALQVISGHWGEMVPFFLARLDEMIPPSISGLPRTLAETFKQQVYVTPSGMFDLPHFQFIHQVVGADRIMYAVDYPYLNNQGARAFLENAPISLSDKEKIAHGNAEKLFNL